MQREGPLLPETPTLQAEALGNFKERVPADIIIAPTEKHIFIAS